MADSLERRLRREARDKDTFGVMKDNRVARKGRALPRKNRRDKRSGRRA